MCPRNLGFQIPRSQDLSFETKTLPLLDSRRHSRSKARCFICDLLDADTELRMVSLRLVEQASIRETCNSLVHVGQGSTVDKNQENTMLYAFR